MDDRDALAAAEAEMVLAADRARVRGMVAAAWLRAADAELSALDKPVWGGVVDQWHDAVAAVMDAAEAVAAFQAFPPVD